METPGDVTAAPSLIDAFPHPAALVDADGRLVRANPAWMAVAFGEGLPAGVGRKVEEQIGGGEDAAGLRSVFEAVRSGEPRASGRYVGGDGRSYFVTASRLPDGGALAWREPTAAAPEEGGAEERRQRFLAEAGGLLLASLEGEPALRSLARMAVPEVADFCVVELLGDDRSLRRVAVVHVDPKKADAVWEAEPTGGEPLADVLPRVVRTGEGELFAQVDEAALSALGKDGAQRDALRRAELQSALVVPVAARGRVLGRLVLGVSRSGRPYGPRDLAFASGLGERAGLAVDNARLFREAQDANRLKDEFLATLSHELRTPLNAIVGWAHVLRGGPLDKAVVARAVDTIDRNARAQTQLISDILDMSRIVTGRLRLSVGPVELPAVVEAAVELARPAALAKEIRLEADVDPLAGPVSGDPDRLQQVVGNLLANAVKYTPKGGRIRVVVRRRDGQAEIAVEDTGVGITADYLPRLFDRFRHPDASTTRGHGIGLGLAIVRHLVELHGGTVEANSAGRGLGSTFVVRLPLLGAGVGTPASGPAADPRSRGAARAGALPSLDGVRVLVVDDEKDSRDVIVAVLEQRGAKVIEASSVEEAMALLASEQPDVLLSDIGLPEEDGYSLMRRIRALPKERGGSIPAAALTAYARSEDRMQALLAGFQIHVPKPVQPAELIAVVSSLASRRAPKGQD